MSSSPRHRFGPAWRDRHHVVDERLWLVPNANEIAVETDRAWPSHEEALHPIALLGAEKGYLFLRLDTFGHDRELQPAPEPDDGPDDLARMLV